jgi:hypothetical protein
MGTRYAGPSSVTVLRSTRIIPPPCECGDCSQQYRTKDQQKDTKFLYANYRSEADAETFLKGEITKIHGDQQYLRDVLSKHGNTILGRWKKKSVSKRAECLVKAFPGMEPNKRPILQYILFQRDLKLESDYRNAYLLPYLSQEDLKVDPLRFLRLLHCRANYEIDEWVPFDTKQTSAGYNHGRLALEHCPSCVVMYGSDYGKLVPWNKDEAHRWYTIGYPRAQIIVEAQRVLMEFLRKTVEDLLEGVEIESSSSKWIELRESGFRKSNHDETWSAWCNQAYTGPPTFNIDSILEISRARMANAEDHLWLLQTDPSYMHSEISYFSNSRLGNIIRNDIGSTKVYHYAAGVLTDVPINRVQDWYYIVEECMNMQKIYQAVGDNVHPGQPLPPKYNDALACLELLVLNVVLKRVKMLSSLLPRLRGFESCFSRTRRDRRTRRVVTAPVHDESKVWYEKDPLFWCLIQMTADPEELMTIDPAVLFGFFDDLMAQPTQYSVDITRIEQRLMDELSDFGAVWELLLAIRYHRPVNQPFHKSDGVRVGSARAFWRRWDCEDRHVVQKDIADKILGTVLKKLNDKRMPSGKKDLEWLDGAKEVRELLKAFWDQTRSSQRLYLEQIQSSEEDIKMFLSLVSFDLAPEHVAALQEERDAVLKRLATIDKMNEVQDSTKTYLDPSMSDNPAPPPTIPTKGKTKTRAEPVNAPEPTTSPPSATVIEPPATLAVKPHNLIIFQRMYPLDTETPSGGYIEWRKFVAAMADAGFPATHGAGSAVTFSNGRGRIIFHKPHPVAKIDPVMLASFGKRLTKWFGWQREVFVVAAASGEENE